MGAAASSNLGKPPRYTSPLPELPESHCLTRVKVHFPSIALVLLDEATSAMPTSDEARIYTRLRELGIAFVSIGHRASLEAHHDEVIEL